MGMQGLSLPQEELLDPPDAVKEYRGRKNQGFSGKVKL